MSSYDFENDAVESYTPAEVEEEPEAEAVEVAEPKSRKHKHKAQTVEVELVRFGAWTDPQTGDVYTINQPVEVDEEVAERLLGVRTRHGGRVFVQTSD